MADLQSQIDLLKAGQKPVLDMESATALAGDAADQFFAAALMANKITPAEKSDFRDQYIAAALDDLQSPLASGKKRTGFVAASIANRRPMNLTTELVNSLPSDARVLQHSLAPKPTPPNQPTPEGEPVAQDRKAKLLAMTEEGRAVLADMAKHAK